MQFDITYIKVYVFSYTCVITYCPTFLIWSSQWMEQCSLIHIRLCWHQQRCDLNTRPYSLRDKKCFCRGWSKTKKWVEMLSQLVCQLYFSWGMEKDVVQRKGLRRLAKWPRGQHVSQPFKRKKRKTIKRLGLSQRKVLFHFWFFLKTFCNVGEIE